MSGVVFFETLRRTWRGTLLWGIGIASLGILTVAFMADSQMLTRVQELMKSLPPFMLNMLGGADTQFSATPQGLLSLSYFGRITLIFGAYGVIIGLNVTAIEEDRGIMDILLSMPIPRWRLVVEKFAAYAVNVTVIVLISFVLLWLTIQAVPIFAMDAGLLFQAHLSVIPSTLFVIGATALIGAFVRRRGTATGIAATFVAGSYFVDVLGQTTKSASVLRALSYDTYFNVTEVLQHGIAWANLLGMTGAVLLTLIGTVMVFQRRDVGL